MGDRITISPITRLEGHGKIDIFLDDDGNVEDCFFQVVELRGFEKFLVGRPAEELPRITPKICGVCPGAHHMASTKALDALFKVEPPPDARRLRELYLAAHIAHSHILHFFALGAPDFLPGSGAEPGRRNVLGLISEVGEDVGRLVLKSRGYCQKIQGIIGGHPIHPVVGLPGGMSKPLAEEDRDKILPWGDKLVAFGLAALEIFRQQVLSKKEFTDLIAGDIFYNETHYAGLVDPEGKVNFYGGKVRVIDPAGDEVSLFEAGEYLEQIAERVLPWSYLKFPYLKSRGWQGLKDGPDSGIFRVNSLARLNVSSGMATAEAHKAYAEMYDFFGKRPVHSTLAFHWARLIELLYCCEQVQALINHPDITSTEVRASLTAKPEEGVGVVEAARGTLYHHYKSDPKGMIKEVNLIVATAQNNGAMGLSVKKAAEGLIKNGAADGEILNMVEMAFRAYDPCLACATHALPGSMALRILVHQDQAVVRDIRRF